MKKFKMFVYGTLMEGYRNYHKYLDGKVLSAKRAYTLGKLYHLDKEDCPAIVKGDQKVFGQILECVDDENYTVLKAVDSMEKHFQGNEKIMYERVTQEVFYEDGTKESLGIYFFVNQDYFNENHTIFIEHGDWDKFKKDRSISREN